MWKEIVNNNYIRCKLLKYMKIGFTEEPTALKYIEGAMEDKKKIV